MEIYDLINDKFEKILSGECLTSLREENKKIANSYVFLEEQKFIDIKNKFIKYISNYLYLKNYTIIEKKDNSVTAQLNDQTHEFLVDFDWENEENSENIKLKILDKGLKTGISSFDGKYLFIFSIKKGLFYLMSCETLKKQIKDNKKDFNILSENTDLFKTQFIFFKPSQLNQKIKIFSIK
jgi:hypothetical protein